MARDHHVNAGIELIENWTDFTSEPRAAVRVAGFVLLPALMKQHHDGVRALGFEHGNQRIDRRGFTRKAQPLDPARRHQIAGALQGQPDQPDPHALAAAAESADRIARKQCLPAFGQCAGGEELELCAGELLNLARFARRQLRAAAALHPQQLIAAAIKFVIAHRIEIQPDAVEDADGRLVQIDRRGELRGADQITRRYGQVMRILRAQAVNRAGQKGRTASRHPHRPARSIRGLDRLARRFKTAVKIIDRDDPDRHRHRGLGRLHAARCHTSGNQWEQAEGNYLNESRSARSKADHAAVLAEPGGAASTRVLTLQYSFLKMSPGHYI